MDSALACFQWGVLAYRGVASSRAIEWLERAVRLEGQNYWYHFLLGYLEDKAGLYRRRFQQLQHRRGTADRIRPGSCSAGRGSTGRGGSGTGLAKTCSSAPRTLEGRPEATRVRLELGYLYQQVGDFDKARREYDLVIAADGIGRSTAMPLA